MGAGKPSRGSNREGPSHDNGSNRYTDGCAFACINIRRSITGFCGRAELPFNRKHRSAPLLLRCSLASQSEEALCEQYRLIVGRKGPFPRGRSTDRSEAKKHLPRLLSSTAAGAFQIAPTQGVSRMTQEDVKGRRVGRQRKRALHLAGIVIDERADASASSKVQSTRKQRLLEGHAEFRAARIDRSDKRSRRDK